ncbi:chemotaxis protein MotB [Aliiroseovarius sp. S2029]|uniref:flagellar motor protein MotB n=1 Tax=Aliiroseovarius sp. S2029 TaxID=2936988 RepID=UPI0020C13B9D|nr:flagellar motor protein MotB [Aliiroseovarius sp. S2029]MCK8484250.1 chemotaxis protein MotB [Aliiroseovarius sp. S2029]
MRANANAPVIIKRVKKVSGGGHHGGAWKVAYADFVTAMMAFFLLMWLLNATTEKQRKGIADYFNPTIPVTRVSGGGDGSFGGDSVFVEETLSQTGNGGIPRDPTLDQGGLADDAATENARLEELEQMLFARGGESMASDDIARHIVTRVTDEGLLVELFDLDGAPLFEPGTTVPTAVLIDLVAMIARVFDLVENGVAIEGHVATQPVVVIENTAWALSIGRATQMRKMFEESPLGADRITRVTGHADREPVVANAMAIRNNRIELILLRSGR